MSAHTVIPVFALVALLPAGAAFAASDQGLHAAQRWTYSLTPYAWLPSVDGTMNFGRTTGGGSPSVSVDEDDVLDALDFAAMIAGEVRHEKWSLFGDFIYLKLSTDKSAVRSVGFSGRRVNVGASLNADTEAGLKGGALTVGLGYALAETNESRLDAFAGLRYFHVKADLDWDLDAAISGPGPGQTLERSGSASDTEDLVDGIVGVRGRVRLADRWFVPFYFDIGAGSSDLTWQAYAGISYAFKWGDVTLGYRHLEYDQADDKLLKDFEFKGPMLSAMFQF